MNFLRCARFISLFLCAFPAMAQDTSFSSCLLELEKEASKANISAHHFKQYTKGLEPNLSLLDKLNYQPEFRTPIWDYLASLVDEERINEGKTLLKTHHAILQKASERFGVDPETIVAVWGVESNFGQNLGKYPLVESLATLSCVGRRQAFFRKELFAALRILQSGDIHPSRFIGSWAGAFGHTQFMPSTFERLAVDFDHDGRRDLMDNVADALGSTANYLHQQGWKNQQVWGVEVRIPSTVTPIGRKQKKSIQYWTTQGVTLINGQALSTAFSPTETAGLLLPAGPSGPAFLVFKNFDVIYSYNAAESYALAIAHLSDRLRGKGAFLTPWPSNDLGLSREERKELQRRLQLRGHDIGEIDGMIGGKTRQAIKIEQERLGMSVDGRAGQLLFKALAP